jgi:hypothetical protein
MAIWLAAGISAALDILGCTTAPEATLAMLAKMPAASSAIFCDCDFPIVIFFLLLCLWRAEAAHQVMRKSGGRFLGNCGESTYFSGIAIRRGQATTRPTLPDLAVACLSTSLVITHWLTRPALFPAAWRLPLATFQFLPHPQLLSRRSDIAKAERPGWAATF